MASPSPTPASPTHPAAGGAEGDITISDLSHSLVRYSETLTPLLPTSVRSPTRSAAGSPRCASPTSPGKAEHASLDRDLVPMDGSRARPKEILAAEDVLALLFPQIPSTEVPGYAKEVSSEPGTNLEVIALQEQLELRLRLRSARHEGVCQQRQDVYSQCFDEIIRQVTTTCPERGLLLSRVRDEIDTTIAGYKSLIDTASSLGMRKVMRRNIQREIEKEHVGLEYEVQIQQKRVQALAAKLGKTKKIIEDRQKLQEAQHEEEMRFIKKGNVQLNNELKRLTAAASG